jgi:hypothetical protein
MSTNASDQSSDGSGPAFQSVFPNILLASDNSRSAHALYRTLSDEGFAVQVAPSYNAVQILWQQHRHPVVLLDVSNIQAVDAAIDTALSLKRSHPAQFVAYLADPILRTSGLAGDAIFPRNLQQLPQALRKHFSARPDPQIDPKI